MDGLLIDTLVTLIIGSSFSHDIGNAITMIAMIKKLIVFFILLVVIVLVFYNGGGIAPNSDDISATLLAAAHAGMPAVQTNVSEVICPC